MNDPNRPPPPMSTQFPMAFAMRLVSAAKNLAAVDAITDEMHAHGLVRARSDGDRFDEWRHQVNRGLWSQS